MKRNVFIIGGGVAGLSIAYQLLREGHAVTLADGGRAGQSSWAGAGILCPLLPWQYDEAVNRLALAGMRAWPAWAAEIAEISGIDPEYWACGMEVALAAVPGGPGYPLPASPGERGRGLPPSPLAGEGRGGVWTTRHQTPSPLAGEGRGGVSPPTPTPETVLAWCHSHELPAQDLPGGRIWLPTIGQIRNPRLLHALKAAVERLGGRLVEDDIAGLRTEGRQAVAAWSASGEYPADVFVWAGGAWAGLPLGEATAVPGVRPVRGQMLLYAPGSHELDHILYHDGLYLVPRRDGHLLVGSTLENTGFETGTTPETLNALHQAACRLLPELGTHRPIRSWAGLRPGSPDNLPVIDRHPEHDNVWINGGHFRYGVTMAPASARLLLELMNNTTPFLDPAPYSWQAAAARRWQDATSC